MANFVLSEESVFSLDDKQFLVLGKNISRQIQTQSLELQQKLEFNHPPLLADYWGTLGWEGDLNLPFSGELQCSTQGNPESGFSTLTRQEANQIKAMNPEATLEDASFTERFINFDRFEFTLAPTFNPAELPRLRLTLFLKPEEGALVYKQYSRKNNYDDEEAFLEYVMYEKSADPNRDRLTYLFDIEPNKKLIPVDKASNLYRLSEEDSDNSFILKVITFSQKADTEKNLYQRFITHINIEEGAYDLGADALFEWVGKDKYNFLVFDPNGESPLGKEGDTMAGKFIPVTHANQVETDVNTLFLIHGTFVNTHKSFHDLLLKQADGSSVLTQWLLQNRFDQIIAFDHPTISHDAAQNTNWLMEHLHLTGIVFTKALNVLTTSRGALVAEYMASHTPCKNILPIQKVMMFSAANGCGYFTAAKYISKGLSVWKKTASGPALKIIYGILQLSVDFFRNLPGSKLMTIDEPDNHLLESILSAKPNNPNIIYRCVVSDWQPSLTDGIGHKIGMSVVDAIIKVILGWEHDWVIGCKRQVLVPTQCLPNSLAPSHRLSIHGRYLEPHYVQNPDGSDIERPQQVIEEFFIQTTHS